MPSEDDAAEVNVDNDDDETNSPSSPGVESKPDDDDDDAQEYMMANTGTGGTKSVWLWFQNAVFRLLGGSSRLLVGRIRRRAEGRTGQTGVYFTQPPRRTPFARVLVPGSGATKKKHF